jgi:hypothetical protein
MLCAIGLVGSGFSVRAGNIVFSPDGSGTTYTIGGIDPAPGNALALSSIPLTVGATFQLDYQAAIPALIGTNGIDFTPPGLGSAYQLTTVGRFTEVVTSVSAGGTVATFQLASKQPSSFFEIYYNPTVVANNLTGTGFNVGTLVLAGTPAPNLGNVSIFTLSTSGGNPVIQAFDQFGTNHYPGITTVVGSGSSLLTANITSFNSAFVKTPISEVTFNSSIVTPFAQVDPSGLFVGAPGTAPPDVVPHIGTINGVSGPDFQLQEDSNLSFTPSRSSIPEPASMILASLGQLGGLYFVACKRK